MKRFSRIEKFKRYTICFSEGAVFARKFNEISKNQPKKHVFEKGHDIRIDEIETVTKKFKNPKHLSTKLSPIQASLKKVEKFVYITLLERRNKTKPNFKLGDLVVTADKKILEVTQQIGAVNYT